MLSFKIQMLFFILKILSVGADHLTEDVNFELTTATPSFTALPIVLQLSTTISSNNLKQSIMAINSNLNENHVMRNHSGNYSIVKDIEVFVNKPGPQMAKQEEEEAQVKAEEQAEPEEQVEPEEKIDSKDENTESEQPTVNEEEPEEPKVEESPVDAEEPKPEAEVEAEVPTETEAETPNDEPVPEAESDVEPAAEGDAAAGNEDTEMSNNEPSKTDADETTKATATANNDKDEISCFTCTSNDDLKCFKSPTQQTLCPKGTESEKEKQQGCYTLYETDTNITTRGCIDELDKESLKYCLTNEKFCELCYKTGCNNKTAPNSGNKQQLNIFSILLNMMILMTIINKSI